MYLHNRPTVLFTLQDAINFIKDITYPASPLLNLISTCMISPITTPLVITFSDYTLLTSVPGMLTNPIWYHSILLFSWSLFRAQLE